MESVWIFKLGLSFLMKSISNTKQSNSNALKKLLDVFTRDALDITDANSMQQVSHICY